MFAHDWPDEIDPPGEEQLPMRQRCWYRRMRERDAALARFDRDFPNFFQDLGRATAASMQEEARKILMGEEDDV